MLARIAPRSAGKYGGLLTLHNVDGGFLRSWYCKLVKSEEAEAGTLGILVERTNAGLAEVRILHAAVYPSLRVLFFFFYAMTVGMVFHQVPVVDLHLLVYLPEDCEVVPLRVFAALAYYCRVSYKEIVQDALNALPLLQSPSERIHPRHEQVAVGVQPFRHHVDAPQARR